MRKAIIVYEEADQGRFKVLMRMLGKRFTIECLCIRSGGLSKEYTRILSKYNADYICTLDMAGFQMDTLLGDPVYNILPAKQIHIIINEDVLTLYGEKSFALNMFLFVPGNIEKWREKYPHIPNIDEYNRLEEDENGNILYSERNTDILNSVVDRVIHEAEG